MIPWLIAALLSTSPLFSAEGAQHAEALFEAGLYDKAIPLYEQLLLDSPSPLIEEKLALAHYHSGHYAKAIDQWEKIQNRSLINNYYLATAYREEKAYMQATLLLETLLLKSTFSAELKQESERYPLLSQELFLYELGLNYYLQKNFDRAKIAFQEISKIESPTKKEGALPLKSLALLYQARIALELQEEQALTLLEKITPMITEDSPLFYELAYLKGEFWFYKENYSEAAFHFGQAVSKQQKLSTPWAYDANYYQAVSYLNLANESTSPTEAASVPISHREENLKKAEQILLTLLSQAAEERVVLALSKCYIAQGKQLNNKDALKAAHELLSRHDLIRSPEGSNEALLLQAEAFDNYAARNRLYRHLTQEGHSDNTLYAKGWYLRGINEFEEGQSLLKAGKTTEASPLFHQAFQSLHFAFQLLKSQDPCLAGEALQYQALAALLEGGAERFEKAKGALDPIFKQPELLKATGKGEPLHYLYDLISLSAGEATEAALIEATTKGGTAFQNKSLFLLALFYYNQQQYEQALRVFATLAQSSLETPEKIEALFFAARSADELNKKEEAQHYREQFVTLYPDHPLAPEASFFLYTYQDYLQGDKAAVKHLDLFLKRYPKSPFAIHGWYLSGLDLKRDRKSPEGKWIRKKNLTAAIDAFQNAESLFETLYAAKLEEQPLALNEDTSLTTLLLLCYQAALERVQTILAVANSSQGAKRDIYLEYAEEALTELAKDVADSSRSLNHLKFFHFIEEEVNYFLVKAYTESGQDEAAMALLDKLIESHRSHKTTRGYFLALSWYEKAMIEKRRQEYQEALHSLHMAEDASKGNLLSPDQKLELWIEESLIYQAMGDVDQAILTLSKAINDDAVSALRIKAMFLRSEAYELQGRKELARRQLETAAKKGGEWGKRAQDKLKSY